MKINKTLKDKVSEFYSRISYPIKIGLTGLSVIALLGQTQILLPTRAEAQQKRTEYLLPIIQDSSHFYPTILEHLLDEVDNSEVNRFDRPIRIFIDPNFQTQAPEVRTKLINATNVINAQKPNTVSLVSDTLSSQIDFMHKENSFGDVEKEYDGNGNIRKVKVYHANQDMNFARLLLNSLGLKSRLEQDDIDDNGNLNTLQSQIFDAYFNFPNRTNLRKFQKSTADTLAPLIILVAPDSVYVAQEFTLDSSGSSDNVSIEKRYWQFRRNFNPNSVFNPDTTTVEDKLTISFADTGFKDIALVLTDPTKNSTLATKRIRVLSQPQPQTYSLTIVTKDVLLKDVVPDSSGVPNLEVLIRNSVTDSLLTSGLTDSKGKITLQVPAIQDSLLMIVRDEAIASTDSVNNLGNYFDIEKKLLLTSDLEDSLLMIPVIPIVSTIYKNILNYIKYVSGTNESVVDYFLLHRWNDMPIPIFLNRNTVDPVILDRVIHGLNQWKDKTGFVYKGNTLQPLNLWTESPQEINPETGYGVNMMYENSIPRVDFVRWDGAIEGRNIRPGFMRVNVKPDGADFLYTIHEFAHAFNVMIGKEGQDNLYASRPGATSVYIDEGKTLRIIQSLPQFTDMGIYRED